MKLSYIFCVLLFTVLGSRGVAQSPIVTNPEAVVKQGENELKAECRAQSTEIAKAHGAYQSACSQIPGFSGPSLCRQNVDNCFSGRRGGEICEQIKLAQSYQTIKSTKEDAESELKTLRDDLWGVEDDMVDLQSDRTKELFKIQKEMDELDKDLMKSLNDLEDESIGARRQGAEQGSQKQKMLQNLENKLKANRLAPVNLQRQYQAKHNELVLKTDIECKRYALQRLDEFRNKKNALKAQGRYTISVRDGLAAAMRGRKGVDQDIANQAYLYCKRDNQQLMRTQLEAMKAELDMKMQEINLQHQDLKNEIESLKQSLIRDAENENEDNQLRLRRLSQKVNEVQKEKQAKNQELQATMTNLGAKEKSLMTRQQTHAQLINSKTQEYQDAKSDFDKMGNMNEDTYKKYETLVSKREEACALIDSYRSNCGGSISRDYCTGVPVATPSPTSQTPTGVMLPGGAIQPNINPPSPNRPGTSR